MTTTGHTPDPQGPEMSTGPDWRAFREVEALARRNASRRDGWVLFAVAFGAAAVIFSLVAIGYGSRAVDQAQKKVASARAIAAANVAATQPTVDVALTEFKIGVPSTLPTGKVTLHITNAGKIEHELLVFHTSIPPARFPSTSEGAVNEDAPGMNKISDGPNIAPGHTQRRVVDFAQPGTYVFVCNLPGHFTDGMSQVVTVK